MGIVCACAQPKHETPRTSDYTPLTASRYPGLAMPTAADERETYRKWGWRFDRSQEPGAVREPIPSYTVRDPDIHGDTEGDDLWTYLMMYRRSGNPVYLKRAEAWLRYFKHDYRACVGGKYANFCYDRDGFLLDHLYGWGLVSWHEHSCELGRCDHEALKEAEALAAEAEAYWSRRVNGAYPVPGKFSMSYYGPRQGGRHLLLLTRVAEATQAPRWIKLRDLLLDLWLQSPDWDARGMYFFGDWSTDSMLNQGAYAAGARLQSPFMIAIVAEAFYHAYRTTGREEIKNKLVAMARFIDQHGLDPTYQYSASVFGIVNGRTWHKYAATEPVTFWDPVYTTSLVNTLVLGYKYSGDRRLYERAKHFFDRGTKGLYGEPRKRATTDRAVHHFVDTIFASASGNRYLEYNKGELQYTYLLFENGGLP